MRPPRAPRTLRTQDALLALLAMHRYTGHAVPADEVARECHVTINAVHQAVHRLRAKGYRIKTTRGGSPMRLWYRLQDPDPCAPPGRGLPPDRN